MKKFNKKYTNSKNRVWLSEIAKRNQKLVDQFILGKRKNPYYTPTDTSGINEEDNEFYALVDWIVPAKTYRYKMASWEEFTNDKSASRVGIIPIINVEGDNYWLLGQFHDYVKTPDPILSDLGGQCEKSENSYDCLFRELREESNEKLTNLIRRNLEDAVENRSWMQIYKGFHGGKSPDTIYFIFVNTEYNEFLNNPRLYTENTGKTGESFGSRSFYNQQDLLNRRYRTAKNLTDFINYLNLQ